MTPQLFSVFAGCWLAWLGLLCAADPSTLASEEVSVSASRLRRIRSLYNSDQWPAGIRRDGFPLVSLQLKGWDKGQLRSDVGYMFCKFVAAEGGNERPAIVIGALVADSIDSAHKALLVRLAGRQSPLPAPSVRDLQLEIGDVGYAERVGKESPSTAWIAFVRGNIFVLVANAQRQVHPDLDLGAVAAQLDRIILSRPALVDDRLPPRPSIDRFSSQKPVVGPGEHVRLEISIIDPGRGTPHLEWVLGGAGQGYVEQVNQQWHFYPTKAGQILLRLEVTASTGTFASREIQLTALPRPGL